MSRIRLFSCLMAILIVVAAGGGSTLGGVIDNGDFSTAGTPPDPFAGWTTDLGLGDRPTDGGGYAEFTVTDAGEARQLEQKFTLPALALTLSFEIKLMTSPGGTTDVFGFDSFQAALFDLDSSGKPNNPLFPHAPSFFAFYSLDSGGPSPEFYDPAYVSVTSLSNGWRQVTLDLSSLPSQGLLLDFSQFGSDDGLSSTVQLDNVLVNVVPEPALLTIWAGLCLIVLARRLKARGSEKRSQDRIGPTETEPDRWMTTRAADGA